MTSEDIKMIEAAIGTKTIEHQVLTCKVLSANVVFVIHAFY